MVALPATPFLSPATTYVTPPALILSFRLSSIGSGSSVYLANVVFFSKATGFSDGFDPVGAGFLSASGGFFYSSF